MDQAEGPDAASQVPACENGGQHDGIKCVCPDEYFGSLCEVPLDPVCNPQGSCKNGGQYDGIKCVCPDEYYGSLCEEFVDRRL